MSMSTPTAATATETGTPAAAVAAAVKEASETFQQQLLMSSGIASQSFDSISDREMTLNSGLNYPARSAVPPIHSSSSAAGTIKRVRRPRPSREDRRSNSHEAFVLSNHAGENHKQQRRNLSHGDFFEPNVIGDALDPTSLQLQQQRLQEQQQLLLQQQVQLQQLIHMQQQQQHQQQPTPHQQQRPLPPSRKKAHRRANSDSASFVVAGNIVPAMQHRIKNSTAAGMVRPAPTTPIAPAAHTPNMYGMAGPARPRLNSADAALVKSSSSIIRTRPELAKTSSGRGPELQSIAQKLGLTPPPSPYGGPRQSPVAALSTQHQQNKSLHQKLFTLTSNISIHEPSNNMLNVLPDKDFSEMDPFFLPRFNSNFNNYNAVTASTNNTGSPYPTSTTMNHGGSGGNKRRLHMRHHSAQMAMAEVKGTVQQPKCHHVVFAILFYAQLIAVLVLSTKYGHSAMSKYHHSLEGTDGEVELYILKYPHVLQMAIFAGFFACAFSGLTLIVLTVFSSDVIQICLIFSIIMSFAWGTVGIGFQPASFVPITGIIALAFCIGYAFVVWSRIPFAAANLKCGLAGVPLAVVILAYVCQMLALGWSIVWTFGLLGVYDLLLTADDNSNTSLLYILFAISYWWTLQVMKNVIEVTVAGTVGRWWSTPPAYTTNVNFVKACCPIEVNECFKTAMTYSFGSICYGSLLVDAIHILRQVCEPMRPKDSPSLLIVNQCMLPLQRCLFSSIDYLVSRFNQWSFTYVGLYNYDFTQASVLAMQVLESRGWTNIVADDLLNNVLTIFSLVIGGCTGCFCALLERIDNYQLASVSNPTALSFGIGFLIGLVLSSILMGVVSSSVNTVIICFAENPMDFQRCHPDLCEELDTAWIYVWPGSLSVATANNSINNPERGTRPSMARAFLPCHPDLCEELDMAWIYVWPGSLSVATANNSINNPERDTPPSMARAFLP